MSTLWPWWLFFFILILNSSTKFLLWCLSDKKYQPLQKLRKYTSLCTTKLTKWHVRPAKTQISLCIHTVWSESLLSAHWVATDPRFLHADSKDSDRTGRMPRLIWVFTGCTGHFVGFVMLRLISHAKCPGWHYLFVLTSVFWESSRLHFLVPDKHLQKAEI